MKLAWSILTLAHADVWYGEEDVATITNIGGGAFGYGIPSDINWLFDDDYDTVYASNPSNNKNADKHLLVTFNEPINFQALTIRKWSKTTDRITTMRYIGATAFKDVCLVLNGDVENQLCTDSYKGWSWDESNHEISWVMPRFPVQTVALYFRDSYINAADLKIFYEPIYDLTNLDVWHGEEDIATFDVTTACLNPNCQNCHVSNLFDDSIYSFYFSESDDECRKDPNKHLKTTFEDPINFHAITLHKRITGSGKSPSDGGSVIWPSQHCCSAGVSTFNNVCLVLDGDVDNQLCTDADWGWSYDDWETNKEITWYLPRDDVKSVELVFKEDAYMIGTDLKIFHSSTSTTTGPTTTPTEAPPISDPTPEPSNVPLIWYGDKDVATLENIGGGDFGAQNTGIENLFDNDFESIFASDNENNENLEKHFLITFNEPINFEALAIRRTTRWEHLQGQAHILGFSNFKDVCLVLNGDIENQLCTDSYFGWSSDESNMEIKWVMPTLQVTTVALFYRHDTYMSAADLKIFYERPDVWHGEMDVASFENTGGLSGTQNGGLENLFDDSEYSMFASDVDLNENPEKHLKTIFNDPINFQAVTLHKRFTANGGYPGEPYAAIIPPKEHCCYAGTSTFLNVCLVLDDDFENELCTDAAYGWSYDDYQTNKEITWLLPRNNVRSVALVFKEDTYIWATDFKIYHREAPFEDAPTDDDEPTEPEVCDAVYLIDALKTAADTTIDFNHETLTKQKKRNENRLKRFKKWLRTVVGEFEKDLQGTPPNAAGRKMQECMQENFESVVCALETEMTEVWNIAEYCEFTKNVFDDAYDGCVVTTRNGRTLRWLEKRCDRLIKIQEAIIAIKFPTED